MLCILCVTVVVLTIAYFFKLQRRPQNFPPGPAWSPVFGNFKELAKLSKTLGGQHLALSHLSKQYQTNVLGLKLGGEYVVTVFSYDVVKAVLKRDEYEGRPDNFFIRLRSMGTRKGVTCTDGHHWSTQRNFLVKHLRDLGFGKKPMERMIKSELTEILNILDCSQNKGFQITKLLAPSVLSVLWALAAGFRFSRDDIRLQRLLELLEKRSKVFDMSGGTLSHYPWIRFVAPEKTGFNVMQDLNKQLRALLMDVINQHITDWTPGREDDIIYSFISVMKGEDKKESETFTYDQLIMICLDIFIAGSQTTSNTLGFAFLMMVLHPDVQQKVQESIDKAFGNNNEFFYADRQKVPYVEAVLLEVTRYCLVTPICGPRRVLRNTELEGYFIPKETTVLISLYSVHMDEEFWTDPTEFRPERFLNEQGEVLTNDRVLPFGLGKRRCLGEILARSCIFLFFTGILQKYTVCLQNGGQKPTGIPLPGITLSPENYSAVFIQRTFT